MTKINESAAYSPRPLECRVMRLFTTECELKTCKKCLNDFTGDRCRVCSNVRHKEYQRKIRRASGVPVRGECVFGTTIAETRRRNQAKWRKLHPEESKAAQDGKREKVTPGYAASCLGVRVSDLPIEMLEAKAVLIRLNRQLKEPQNV